MAKRGNPKIAELGKETRFTAKNAVEMARRSNDAQREAKALQELLRKNIPLELVAQAIKTGVAKCDPRLLELLLKLMGLMPAEKLEAVQTVTIKDDWRKIADDLGIKPEG